MKTFSYQGVLQGLFSVLDMCWCWGAEVGDLTGKKWKIKKNLKQMKVMPFETFSLWWSHNAALVWSHISNIPPDKGQV